uniref:DDE Tnp4 domain-containing protein n=1 Tax=Salvator merianae TaxID=96440 RepID=A0A8D0DHI9_SALMN
MDEAQKEAAIMCVVQSGTLMMQYLRASNEASSAAASRRRWAFLHSLGQRRYEKEEEEDSEEEEEEEEEKEVVLLPRQASGPGFRRGGRLRSVERRFWARPRSTEWWDRTVLETWDDEQWLQNFRMRKATFLELCARLAPALQRQKTRMRIPLSVEKRVAIALWKLATSVCYRDVGNQFGVGRSTAGSVVLEVCRAIQRVLMRSTVTVGNKLPEIIEGFKGMGFPNCAGIVGTTHMPILCPPHQAAEYVNTKGYYSMALQALVDHRGQFTHLSAGWPGKTHEAKIFNKSTLFTKGQEGTLFTPGSMEINGVTVPRVILGGPAYPLLPWLMVPYTEELDSTKESFNATLSRCQEPLDEAFSRLKGRWRCLTGRNDCAVENLPRLISACCVLHNICEEKGEAYEETWEAEAKQLAATFEQPLQRPDIRIKPAARSERVRDALCAYIAGVV